MKLIFGMVKNNIFICKNSNLYTYKKNIYRIAYDGYIYNYFSIKQELLSKGYYFETYLEEEIILKAYIEYGFNSYNKFSGHFSIAIWNETKKELILMRDAFSVKSFYYKKENTEDIVFSNDLSELLNLTNNIIEHDSFINSYLVNFKIEDGLITDTIMESANIMLYSNKIIRSVELDDCGEYGYIFDEVAQIVLNNLDNISLVKIEDEQNEISIVAQYILEKFKKSKIVVSKVFSKDKLTFFLSNMNLPFYNLAEYNLVFALNGINSLALVDLEALNIKKFYNIDFFNKQYNVNLILPSFGQNKIFKIEEIYYPNSEYKTENCIDKKFVEQMFWNMLKQTIKPICDFVNSDINYYMMIYFIRLDNWINKYNIKII